MRALLTKVRPLVVVHSFYRHAAAWLIPDYGPNNLVESQLGGLGREVVHADVVGDNSPLLRFLDQCPVRLG